MVTQPEKSQSQFEASCSGFQSSHLYPLDPDKPVAVASDSGVEKGAGDTFRPLGMPGSAPLGETP